MTERTGRRREPQRRLRLWAVSVFLIMFLSATGFSGAAALWSQQATATATVTTGMWIDYTRPGFSMPLNVQATRQPSGDSLLRYRGVALSWQPAAALPAGVTVTYHVTGAGISGPNWIENGLPYTGAGTGRDIRVSRPFGGPETWQITVTPLVNGVSGTPTTVKFTIDRSGTLTQS